MSELRQLLAQAREASWAIHGKRLTIFLPGMFTAYGRTGRYPAVSLTGDQCEQGCAHCGGRLLTTMLKPDGPQGLEELGARLKASGQAGMLLSGGSDRHGRLPWADWLGAIARVKDSTGLTLTAHVGRIDVATATALKAAGVSQALVDVVGHPDTAREILHLPDGLAAQGETLSACAAAGLEVVPHVILGLHGGRLKGEARALEIVAAMAPRRVVWVVLMPMKGTELAGATPPKPKEVAAFLAEARLRLPQARHHLGCARPRGRYRHELDALAVEAGVNALAIGSDAACQAAARLGVEVEHIDTCCSLGV